MKDEDLDMALIKVLYTVSFIEKVLETNAGIFYNAEVRAEQSNVFYVNRKDNLRNHVLEQLDKSGLDRIIDVRIIETKEVD